MKHTLKKKVFLCLLCLAVSVANCFATPDTGKDIDTSSRTGSSKGFPVLIKDSRELEVAVEKKPERLVSLSPSFTEILYAVGAGDQTVGITTYCNYPEEALTKEKIGGFSAKSISVEKIVSLVPDLVFADSSTHSVIAEALEKVGIKVIAFNSRSFEDIYTTIELVSITTGHLDQGRKLVIEMRERVSAVSEKVTTIPVGKHLRVFWEIFDAPLMTAGPGTFISQLITIAGGINIFADVKEDWPKVSPEEVIMRNPDILMSSDSHGDNLTIDQVKSRTGWAELSAVKNGWIYLFDGDVVSRPGPRIVDALEAIAKALYPELFR